MYCARFFFLMLVELTHRPPTTPPALRVAGGKAYSQVGVVSFLDLVGDEGRLGLMLFSVSWPDYCVLPPKQRNMTHPLTLLPQYFVSVGLVPGTAVSLVENPRMG